MPERLGRSLKRQVVRWLSRKTCVPNNMNMGLDRFKEDGISFLKSGGGDALVLLHGIPGSSFSWEGVGLRLKDQFQVIIPDLLGFGESDSPRGDYYMTQQANSLHDLLSDLGVTSAYIAGHDFGGPVALTMMRLFPDFKVKGLILSDTNVFTDTFIPLPLRMAKVPFLAAPFYKMMAGNRLGLQIMYQQAFVNKSDTSWQSFKRHLTRNGMDLTAKIFQRSVADLKGNYGEIEAMLPEIDVPTLVLWGAEDPFFAVSVGHRTHAAIKNSFLRIYPETGHFVPEERSAEVAQDIIDFVDSGHSL